METKTDTNTRAFFTVAEVKAANKAAGRYFFSPDTMGFFNSKLPDKRVYGGRYFITSEQFDESSPRLYTIREVRDDGADIETIGDFQGYRSLQAARAAIRDLPQF